MGTWVRSFFGNGTRLVLAAMLLIAILLLSAQVAFGAPNVPDKATLGGQRHPAGQVDNKGRSDTPCLGDLAPAVCATP
jgi:hypothetical protein